MKTEFDVIKSIRDKAKTQNPKSKILAGIGDDCAVISQNSKTDLVITADLLVEDVDFRRDWMRADFLGHKALAVSLSDIAAMGAKPTWALLSIGVPENIWKSNFVKKFYQGWFDLAKNFNIGLVGGDISKTPDKIVIDSIVAGKVKKNRAILRSGAKVGDLIFVTGELGGAAGGLTLLETGLRFNQEKGWRKKLMQRQLKPLPQIFGGEILAKKQLATAMIDLSDGLSSDLTHLCAASNVGARIYADKIPLDANLKNEPELNNRALSLALNGGEDFELLFTVNPQNLKIVKKLLASQTLIGEITKPSQQVTIVYKNETKLLSNGGFKHF